MNRASNIICKWNKCFFSIGHYSFKFCFRKSFLFFFLSWLFFITFFFFAFWFSFSFFFLDFLNKFQFLFFNFLFFSIFAVCNSFGCYCFVSIKFFISSHVYFEHKMNSQKIFNSLELES